MTNTFTTDRDKLAVQVEEDHVYVQSDCCGCGDMMTSMAKIAKLRDELDAFLERNVSQR